MASERRLWCHSACLGFLIALWFALLLGSERCYSMAVASGFLELTLDASSEILQCRNDESTSSEYVSKSMDTRHVREDMHASPVVDSKPLERDVSSLRPQQLSNQDTEPKHSRPTLMALEEELEAVETMVQLQHQKLSVLEKLRGQIMSKFDLPIQSSDGNYHHHHRDYDDKLEEFIQRNLDAITLDHGSDANKNNFNRFFIEQAQIAGEADVVDVKMAKIPGKSAQDLIVMARECGELLFFVSPSLEVFRMDTGQEKLQSIELDLQSDPPLLVVLSGGASSSVRMHALQLNQHDKNLLPGGRPKAHNHVHATSVDQSIRMDEYSLAVTMLGQVNFEEPREASTLAIVRSSRRRTVLVGSQHGKEIEFYATNGTRLYGLEVITQQPTMTIATNRNMFAFGNSSTIVFSMMTHQENPKYHLCHGSIAAISSIVFDDAHPDLIFSGTVKGEILVHELRFELGDHTCKLVHRTIVKPSTSLQLAVSQGHIMAAGARDIFIFSISQILTNRVDLQAICSTPIMPLSFAEDTQEISADIVPKVITTESAQGARLGILTKNTRGRPLFRLFVNLLPAPTLKKENGIWPHIPLFGVVIVIIVVLQFYFQQQQRTLTSEPWKDLLETHNFERNHREIPSHRLSAKRDTHPPNHREPPMERTRAPESTSGEFGSDHALRRRIANARRETLECSFDDMGAN